MSTLDSRRPPTSTRRLQLVLLLLIIWDVLALLAGLSFGSSLFEINDGKIDGVLATRASFGGAALVPLVLYVFALVRGPLRHWGLLWAGVVEQAAVALFSVYHVAREDITVQAMVIPLVVSLVLLVLILTSLQRPQPGDV